MSSVNTVNVINMKYININIYIYIENDWVKNIWIIKWIILNLELG